MPRISGESSGNGVQAVLLALQTLEFIAQAQRAVGVTELTRAFGTTKSRIYRHLQTLVSAGYLIQETETERYRVSARLMALGQAVSEGYELAGAARTMMRTLRDKLGHPVVLSLPEPDGVRILSLIPGRSNIEIGVKPGSMLEFHSSAQGKLALAYGDDVTCQRVLRSKLAQSTPDTMTDPQALKAEIERTLARGWAVAPNEALIGLNALAAPVFDALGAFAGSLAIVDSIQHIGAEPTAEQIDSVVEAAARISADLGYREGRGKALPQRKGM
ncbi:IclR family transcriptional regulator [Phreatobacter stygius]|uniref:IclR family transcriptional regulator n=1 Tax=Phreatobacter stygius TaxID=1940610 RepID=A0A4D7B0R7_9HYPH|nr:IclR family transcriptional regulator [Phreatobacter stygius]QCI67259.1 IclR family transcriptional regulator [Phreatobacter stygius]